ncbi:hypothetical protein BU25DRAFT_453230 [Macroventuria anomochaeta]|uniref:Uncharacterized protein n=1 Tax=Macroventuria anomochaeta TaxID=301207 RepID=A0ACB6SHG1_9PLEO|nr:uncharacterized protein BU25DRAFT_453230 [Macroventuria anomochaeta]KAF2633469.1 hypothetical protein BU25DRAFT_453230 [Macroventuria anomochaeta]
MDAMVSDSVTASPGEKQRSIKNPSRGSSPETTPQGHDACFITNLSTELVCLIIDFVPPESHLDFACTCKRIADCSSKVLKRHQEAYSKYRVASDISPITIPTLLRSAFGRADPLLAWHVRSIEIWYDRTSWLDWKPLNFDQCLHEEDMDVDSTLWKWQDDELLEYLEAIEGQFDAMLESGDEDIRLEAREQFEDGLDGILKMLLIAYCPRLQDVKFITHEHREKSTLGWLKRVIQGSILYGSHWPPGLCSIQEVAVGVESETWMTTRHTQNEDGHLDGSNKTMEIFSTLLRLPRLNSIYYNDLRRSGWDDSTDYESRTLMPLHSSTVKHIFLDDCSDMPHSFRFALPRAPSALETFTLRAGDSGDRMDDADALVQGLCSEQSASLHTLMFYGPYSYAQIHGYRCSVYRNEELEKADNLKTVAMDISDVELDCLYSTSGDVYKMTYKEQRKYFVKWFTETAFPGSIERLVFWGKAEEYFPTQCKGSFLDWLEDALIAVIQSHRRMEGWDEDDEEYDKLSDAYESFYGNLKAVYLEDVETEYKNTRHKNGEPRADKIYFQRLVEVGREAGIDIHTLTNRVPAKHTHSFPTAPDKYNLRSGSWWERKGEIEDWVFNVYKGRRVPPGCRKCGKCETCLGQYSEELWRSLDR